MVTDTVADCFTRIRNAQGAGHKSVRVSVSSAVKAVLQVLKVEGFIQGFEEKRDRDAKFGEYEVGLKYLSSGDPAIQALRRVSTCGRRVYTKIAELKPVFNALGISILSTSQGVMSDREARRRKIGGEIIGQVG